MVEVFEDVQGLLPGLARIIGIAGGPVAVTEGMQFIGFIRAVAGLPIKAECPFVAGDGFAVPAELEVRKTETVPAPGLSVPIGGFEQAQLAFTVDDGSLALSQHGVNPAHGVEGPSLAGQVTGGCEESKRLLLMSERVVVAGLLLVHIRDVAVGTGLADAVTVVTVQGKSALKVVEGVFEAIHPDVRPRKSTMDSGFAGTIAQPAYGF